jgi:hypothetical protein
MDVLIDGTYNQGYRRLATAPAPVERPDSLAAQVAVSAQAPTQAVTRAGGGEEARCNGEKNACPLGSSVRQKHTGDVQDDNAADDEAKELAKRGGAYDRKLVYEKTFGRLFIDIVDRTEDGDVLMRIPPETLARLLDQTKTALDRADDESQTQPALDLGV